MFIMEEGSRAFFLSKGGLLDGWQSNEVENGIIEAWDQSSATGQGLRDKPSFDLHGGQWTVPAGQKARNEDSEGAAMQAFGSVFRIAKERPLIWGSRGQMGKGESLMW
jgi:hypothetical protein